MCRSPEDICSSLRQDGVKGAADSGALVCSGWWGGRGMDAGRACGGTGGVTLHQPEVRRTFSRGSCPWIMGPWQWRPAQAPGRGGVDSTCACTQASWRLQQP